jgi:hypothetical protein
MGLPDFWQKAMGMECIMLFEKVCFSCLMREGTNRETEIEKTGTGDG